MPGKQCAGTEKALKIVANNTKRLSIPNIARRNGIAPSTLYRAIAAQAKASAAIVGGVPNG